ncbi:MULTISPECIES: hypothetical protein [unclassified Chamaesiphon]|uniref:hypothetical protein n=1 Tax=unclassified Chamaesiphon TaxID=2620921 RepID=UPI00286A2E46|nr:MULTISPECIES: hypothetical protein [unclassified Chamaesiphon]
MTAIFSSGYYLMCGVTIRYQSNSIAPTSKVKSGQFDRSSNFSYSLPAQELDICSSPSTIHSPLSY